MARAGTIAADGPSEAPDRAHPSLLFDRAYRDHNAAVFRLATGFAGRACAPDVTQEVFLRLWRHSDRFDETRGSLRTYLFAMTRNVCVDVLRSETARSARQDRVGREQAEEARWPVPDPAVRADEADRLKLALDALPPDMREAIVVAFFGGLSYRETAEALGQMEGTVKSRIRTGMIRLRADLAQRGDELLEPST